MPSDGFLKGMNAVHRVIMAVTGGRAGWQVGVMPVVELTTVGRKSGEKRTVLLTSPIQEGDDVVIVADERTRWWPSVEAAYKGYRSYQQKTSREIPLVVLSPLR